MNIKLRINQIEEQLRNVNPIPFDINLNESLENQFLSISKDLRKITKPVIYWFECKNDFEAEELLSLYNKSKIHLKAVPPVNGHLSRILYLGVRQGGKYKKPTTMSRIEGRIYHHFGLYNIETTQGLKLDKWATKSNLTIKLNLVELNITENQYLYIIEKLYSLELKPMFGKH